MQNLFRKYLDNQCSPEEVKQLLLHFSDPENELKLKSYISESLETDHSLAGNVDENQWNRATEETYHRIKKQIDAHPRGEVKVIPFFKKTWFRVAASLVIIVSALAWFFFTGRQQNEIVEEKNEKKIENDIAPGGNKAILTLADNSTMILDNAANGALTQQGGTKILKLSDGQLTYSSTTGEGQGELLFNTITTPRGGQYQVVLPDGTKVWLNAASSIRFPIAFNRSERKVEITGEAYFEVQKDLAKPFIVKIDGDAEIQVLGTHFNVNAYNDEDAVKTTLLEGAVKFTNGKIVQMLSPGQQAHMNPDGQISLNKNADTEEVIAWKEGVFHFENTDLKTILRQFARWYDIEVVYEKPVSDEKYFCLVSRNSTLSNVLKSLQANAIQFTIQGKKLYIR